MKLNHAAFTLVEMVVTSAIVAIIGTGVFTILLMGTTLFTKNSAINMAHQQARVSVVQMERNLHEAVSVPQLVNASRVAVNGNGPEAGISFHRYAAGPYQVTPGTTVTPSQTQITIKTNGYIPNIGMRLNIPTHGIEEFISARTVSGNNVTVTLENSAGRAVYTTLGTTPVNVVVFFTELCSYVVIAGQLRFYPSRGSTTPTVLSTNITSATPFSIPVTVAGAPYNRFVAAINLSMSDSSSSNRRFKAANMYLNSQVPYRTRLTETQ